VSDQRIVEWELESCEWGMSGEDKRRSLLVCGWEPFAVAGREIWFKRPVQRPKAKISVGHVGKEVW
jgi:hypothetical protein